jgi:hypothetical protein
MEVDDGERARAVQRLEALGGLDGAEAARLVDAVVAGAVDQAFELVIGTGPVPTTMTTSQADRLRFICERAGRILTQREVELVFRVTHGKARSILSTMTATYEESLLEKFLQRMREDATVVASGSADDGLTWAVRFSEGTTFDTAWAELQRLGHEGRAESHPTNRVVVVPRAAPGDAVDVLAELGLSAP